MFLEHRVKDRSLLRLIAKWLHAGVFEDGVVFHPETGTPQGGVMTPPTQSQTLPGTGSFLMDGLRIEKIAVNDIEHSTFMAHATSAAGADGPVRRACQSRGGPAPVVSAGGRAAPPAAPVGRVTSPSPAIGGRGAAASGRGASPGGDRGFHGRLRDWHSFRMLLGRVHISPGLAK